MKVETFEIEIDGLKVHVTNDPEYLRSFANLDKGYYSCSTIVGDKWARITWPIEMFKDDELKLILAKRLREIIERT